MDGADIANVDVGKTVTLEVPPGKHVLTAWLGGNPSAQNTIDFVPGETFHLECRMKMGAFANTFELTADGREIPYMIVGSGGHPPVENLFETCTKGELERRPPPLDLVLPSGSDLPNGDTAKVVAYNDTDFGFARVTVDINENTLTGEFFTAFRSGATPQVVPGLADSFVLDLKKHKLQK
jgi:hypothetical protein